MDANDTPVGVRTRARITGDFGIVHVPPEDDDIARAVGRGSRRHVFYWRHSPQVLDALPATDRYAVYSDADIIFLRPLDLGSLLGPLARGRIAAAVDESTLAYYHQLERMAATPASTLLPAGGEGGPLLQAGLLFSNPADDGGFYDLFWTFALRAAREGHLPHLPSDDMCIVATLLSQGGPLWERLLPLGHGWNYITDDRKDPEVFGGTAHYGGYRAKTSLLAQIERASPSQLDTDTSFTSGTVVVPADARSTPEPLSIRLPFCLSWQVPPAVASATITGGVASSDAGDTQRPTDAVLFIYVDGQLRCRTPVRAGYVHTTVRCVGAETITIVGVTNLTGLRLNLHGPLAAAR